MANEKAILVDTSKCTACRACQVACKQWNQNSADKTVNLGSYENPPTLSSKTWMRILFNEHFDGQMQWLFTKYQCMHCTDAACVEVCPPNATTHQEVTLKDGSVLKSVVTNPKKCVGCNYCRVACPFDVPGYSEKKRGVFRCTMCMDRVSNAQPGFDIPACVKACAPGTLSFGNRDELLLKAQARVAKLKAEGHKDAQIYGNTQLKGLRYLYVLTAPPASYNLPTDPKVPASVEVWKVLAKPYGGLAAIGVVAALIVNRVIAGRNRGLEEKHKLET